MTTTPRHPRASASLRASAPPRLRAIKNIFQKNPRIFAKHVQNFHLLDVIIEAGAFSLTHRRPANGQKIEKLQKTGSFRKFSEVFGNSGQWLSTPVPNPTLPPSMGHIWTDRDIPLEQQLPQ
jgi:hypothetical protein